MGQHYLQLPSFWTPAQGRDPDQGISPGGFTQSGEQQADRDGIPAPGQHQIWACPEK